MRPNSCIKNRIHARSITVSLCLYIILTGMISPWGSHANAQEKKRGEYEVKAAFIYNFLKFVEWPDKAFAKNSPSLNICIVGDDPFGDAIKIYEGEKVKNKDIIIKHKSLQGLQYCHVVFISRSETERLSQVMNALRGLNVLSIGDADIFREQGVIINFSIVDNKVRFGINVNTARRAGLRISSKLLSLATAVYE